MIYLVVGHRGTGKTTWLKKIQNLIKKDCNIFFDLDQQIEHATGKTIDELLYNKKNFFRLEQTFRLTEIKILNQLLTQYHDSKKNIFISVGAGFKWELQKNEAERDCHIIYLMRETDSDGRIFLDRPRLNINQTPYKEYMSLYYQREKFYQKIKTESYILPEQDLESYEGEKLLFKSLLDFRNKPVAATITLNKQVLPIDIKKWKSFIDKRLSWDIQFLELRDDQFNDSELKFLLKWIPKQKQLLSFRKSQSSVLLKKNLSGVTWDWPIEKGACGFSNYLSVVSLHKRTHQSVDSLCQKILQFRGANHFKLAVPIYNLEELMIGHLWFLQDLQHRSFLPVSINTNKKLNSYRWYRQIFGPLMKLHFIKESLTGVIDQVFLYEHLISVQNKKFIFGAVLGEPVNHSASPAFYTKYFKKWRITFTKINSTPEEFTKKNLIILQKMGLAFVAVTSPLKKIAFQICDEADSSAQLAQSVNTLVFKNQKWIGSCTDQYGLKILLKSYNKNKITNKTQVSVWGGGGLKNILKQEFPYANFYSARTGKMLNPSEQTQKKDDMNIDIVIWAVGRCRMSTCIFPPKEWKTKTVIDLNYTQDSPGVEYALMVGAQYISGKLMFEAQAQKQLEYFLKVIKSL